MFWSTCNFVATWPVGSHNTQFKASPFGQKVLVSQATPWYLTEERRKRSTYTSQQTQTQHLQIYMPIQAPSHSRISTTLYNTFYIIHLLHITCKSYAEWKTISIFCRISHTVRMLQPWLAVRCIVYASCSAAFHLNSLVHKVAHLRWCPSDAPIPKGLLYLPNMVVHTSCWLLMKE